MRHSKVSGLANTVAGKVGGADWDASHVYGLGDIFVVSHSTFVITSAVAVQSWQSMGTVAPAALVNGIDIQFYCTLNQPIVPNSQIETMAHVSFHGRYGAVSAGFGLISTCEAGFVSLILQGGLPAADVEVHVTVYGRVVSV